MERLLGLDCHPERDRSGSWVGGESTMLDVIGVLFMSKSRDLGIAGMGEIGNGWDVGNWE